MTDCKNCPYTDEYCSSRECDELKEKLRALNAAHKAIKMEDETINRLVYSGKQLNYENRQLKDLLKECRRYLIMAEEDCGCDRSELIQQIDEVLQCGNIK